MAQEDGSERWPREWARFVTGGIASQMRYFLERKGMSVTDLATVTRIARPVLSNLINGQREAVSVAELLVLASALEVSPMSLILPTAERPNDPIPGEVRILPDVVWPTDKAALWLGGNGGETAAHDPAPDLMVHGIEAKACMDLLTLLGTTDPMRSGMRDPSQTANVLVRAAESLDRLRRNMARRGVVLPQLVAPLDLLDQPQGLRLLREEIERMRQAGERLDRAEVLIELTDSGDSA